MNNLEVFESRLRTHEKTCAKDTHEDISKRDCLLVDFGRVIGKLRLKCSACGRNKKLQYWKFLQEFSRDGEPLGIVLCEVECPRCHHMEVIGDHPEKEVICRIIDLAARMDVHVGAVMSHDSVRGGSLICINLPED